MAPRPWAARIISCSKASRMQSIDGTGVSRNPKLERVLSYIMSVAVTMVLSPIIGFLGGITWYLAGGKSSGEGFFFFGFASCALIIWKMPDLLFKLLKIMGSKLTEPVLSCVQFGSVGALLIGGVMTAGILFLGHTRPEWWDFETIGPLMIVGFGALGFVGWRIGLGRCGCRKPHS
jgi:hypothetical protein